MSRVTSAEPRRKKDLLAFLLLLLLPAALLGESLFTGDRYLPYDIAEFPPAAQQLSAAELAAVRSTANYDATEAPIWFAIEMQLAREALQQRQLPHWNHYVRNGAPMLAHGHTGFMNPLHLPALLFDDPANGLLYLTYVMFALAGILMFGFLRAMGLGLPAAAFGALAFSWSGTLTANGHWYMRMEALAVLPGMLWAIIGVVNRTGWARALPATGLAAMTALCWLSGFPQYGIPVTMLAGAFGLVFVVREWLSEGGARAALRLLGWLLTGGLLGVLLAMPQLLQMLLFYPESNRPIAESLDRASEHAFVPFGFLGYLMPEAFSHPGEYSVPHQAWPLPWLWSDLKHWQTGEQLLPNYNFTEYAIFPGVVPLLLALLGLVMPGPRWRWFVFGALIAVWLFATGALGFHLAYYLPGIKAVPPYRFAGPACALVAMLAAVGFDGLSRSLVPWAMVGLSVLIVPCAAVMIFLGQQAVPEVTTPDDPWLPTIAERYAVPYSREHDGITPAQVTPAATLQVIFSPNDPREPGTKTDAIRAGRERLNGSLTFGGIRLLLGAGLLIGLAFRYRQSGLRGWPTIAFFGLAAVELGAFSFALNRGQECAHETDTAVHEFLRSQRDGNAENGGFMVGRGVSPAGPYNLPGGTLAAEHIRDLNFYTFVDNKSDLPIRKLYGDGIILRGFVCNALPDTAELQHPYWDLMGLRYVLATQPMTHAGKRVGPEQIGDDDYFVYERESALPRARFVDSLTTIDDENELVDRLADPALDPRATVFVSSADAELLGALPADGGDPSGRVAKFVHEDGKRTSVAIAAGAAGYLVLADTFFPGWQATIDGTPAEIVRGNLYQRVIRIPAKECVLEMRFEAQGFKAGLVVGLAALVVFIVLLFIGIWPRRLADESTQPPDAEPEA